MLKIRCKNCNSEIQGHSTYTKSCGCSNMTTIRDDVISANDLSLVEIITGVFKKKSENVNTVLTKEDLAFQEERKNRKIRKLEFEIR